MHLVSLANAPPAAVTLAVRVRVHVRGGGDQTRAAQQLGTSRGTLRSRFEPYGTARPRS